MPENPYTHYNTLKSTCYMRLWELEGGDGADAGIGFAGGAGRGELWEPPEGLSDEDESDDDGEASESEASDQDFGDFGGDDIVDWDEDTDSEDEEPAPDWRRQPARPAIEIVNPNGGNQRIELPDRLGPQNQARPPLAPVPPRRRVRRRGQGQQGNRQRLLQREPNRQPAQQADGQRAVPAVVRAQANDQPRERPVAAAPGQGNNIDVALQRFLQLAANDQEDEWDSDDDGDNDDEIFVEVRPRGARMRVR